MLPVLALLLGIVAAAQLRVDQGPRQAGAARRRAAGGCGQRLLRHARAARRAAPPIDLRNYLGQPVTLSEYRGKAVLVTFLYANCPTSAR